MPAPIQIGPEPTARAHVGTYYVPPSPNNGSAFAAAMSGFLKTRQPLATAVFMQRLAQAAPKDRTAEIAAARKALADYRIKGMNAENDHFETMQKLYGNVAALKGHEIAGNATVQSANAYASRAANNDLLDYDAAMAKNQELKPQDADAAAKLTNSLRAAAAAAADPNATPEDKEAAKRQFALYMQSAFGASEMTTNPMTGEPVVDNGPLTSLTPLQRQKVAGDIHRMIGTLGGDPSVAPDLAQLVDQYAAAPTQQQTPETNGYPAGGFLRGQGVSGGAALKQGMSLVDQMNALGKTSGPAPGDPNDPIAKQLQDEITRLEAENGKSEYVDFNAPVIKDKPFSDAWQSVLSGESKFAPGVPDYGTDPKQTYLRGELPGNPDRFGFLGGDVKVNGGAPDPTAGLPDRSAGGAGVGAAGAPGRQRIGSATARGAMPATAPGAGEADQWITHNNRMQLGERTTLPGQQDELSSAAHDNLDSLRYNPTGFGGPGPALGAPVQAQGEVPAEVPYDPNRPAFAQGWGPKLEGAPGYQRIGSVLSGLNRVFSNAVQTETGGPPISMMDEASPALQTPPDWATPTPPVTDPNPLGRFLDKFATNIINPPVTPGDKPSRAGAPEQVQNQFEAMDAGGSDSPPAVPDFRRAGPAIAGRGPQGDLGYDNPSVVGDPRKQFGPGVGGPPVAAPSFGGKKFSPEADALMERILAPTPRKKE